MITRLAYFAVLVPALALADFPPAIYNSDARFVETINGKTFLVFHVALSRPSEQEVKVFYKTSDGSAFAGKEYVAKEGTLVFKPHETEKEVSIEIKSKPPAQPDKRFGLVLSNPENATISQHVAVGTIMRDESGSKEGSIEIFRAVATGDVEAVRRLLKENPKLVLARDSSYKTPLQLAAMHKEIVELLLENKAEVNAHDASGLTALHEASFLGQMDVVELLLKNKANIEAEGGDDQTALLTAIRAGHKEVVQLLLAHHANVNVTGGFWVATPLHAAVQSAQSDMLEMLLATKPKVEIRDKQGATPLHYAAQLCKKDAIALLLGHGADVNAMDSAGNTPLTYTKPVRVPNRRESITPAQREECVALLRKHGAVENIFECAAAGKINEVESYLKADPKLATAKTESGWTPLHFATRGGHEPIITLLLSNKADVNVTDGRGSTPLHEAVRARSVEVVNTLISHGAKLNVQDGSGYTPLMTTGVNMEIARILLEHGADVNAVEKNGRTALELPCMPGLGQRVPKEWNQLLRRYGARVRTKNLFIAARAGDVETIKEILRDKPESVNAVEDKFWNYTALMDAANVGNIEAMEVLLAKGADINARSTPPTGNGFTALQGAVVNGDRDVVELLLSHHADVDIADRNGFTPIHSAAFYRKKEIVELLLKHNPKLDTKNFRGETPLQAAEHSSKEIADLLRQHGAKE